MGRLSPRLTVRAGAATLEFGFEDVLRHHGGDSPGGVALAFKALERGLPAISPREPVERREVAVRTAFGGPGARDAFECVLGAVGDDRYTVDAALERPDLPPTRARFVFRLEHRGSTATMTLRDGFVTAEFIDLAGRDERTAAEAERLRVLKGELADRVIAAPAGAVFDL